MKSSMLFIVLPFFIRLGIVTGLAGCGLIGIAMAPDGGDRLPWVIGGAVLLIGLAGVVWWLIWESYAAMQRQLPFVLLLIAIGLAGIASGGVRLFGDHADWTSWMVVGAGLIGAAGCIYDSMVLTALPGQIVLRLLVITGLGYVGVQPAADRAGWPFWIDDWQSLAVTGVVLFVVSRLIDWFFGWTNNFWTAMSELTLVAGLGALVIAGIWILDQQAFWLAWAYAVAWFVGLVGCVVGLFR